MSEPMRPEPFVPSPLRVLAQGVGCAALLWPVTLLVLVALEHVAEWLCAWG